MTRPTRTIAVVGTGTGVGKTWVSERLIEHARRQGLVVAARKPVQSFDAADPAATDAELLARASGESPDDVCPPHRWYPVAMAPPMAADALGKSAMTIADLASELTWPAPADLGVVESVGGVRSPIAHDADSADFVRAIAPDDVLLVADAGLGTINAVRLSLAALEGLPTTVLLNRFDETSELHRRNLAWLSDRDGYAAFTDVTAWFDRGP